MRNVPPETTFAPAATRNLFEDVSDLAGVKVEQLEIHIENTQYKLLRPDGTLTDQHGVHVFVEWHEGRSVDVKKAIGEAIHTFLRFHGLGEGTDITFRDSPLGESFVYNGKLVR